ncbi:MAG: NADH-quinone oxidoreductase subunit L [Planctomycetes bacterium]|nr:NADH-quinone oxidoreductase subunit L [Planctomycetota bacterium]
MSGTWLLWFIPLLPLFGAAACGLIHFATLAARKKDPSASGPSALAPLVACGAMLGALGLSIAAFKQLAGLEVEHRVIESAVWPWIHVGSLHLDISMVVDPLSAVMLLVVTGIGFLIHVYSAGYMKGDPGYAKFFAYLNLFVFSMLMLVLSSSLIGLFVGWEGVGLCSYLLIGFWYEKGWPAEAGQKAFIFNRVGDASFLIGSFILIKLFGTLDLSDVNAAVAGVAADPSKAWWLTVAALCLFGGCTGKSAQIPLFTWLPDAMAGPTPVSALIHAATMVTAGVYLVVRLNPVFAFDPMVLTVIGTIGAFTALIGGTSAIFQRDIKKVLAYSTVSQLGYMFLGLGSGAFAAAIFHLVTHAFFKGLLFLGAGSVIHGMHDEQDMHKMGGLRRHMPKTFVTFLAGAAALSGLPLLSGYFSKDEILAHTFAHGGFYYVLWGIGLFTAAVTAFYTWRMVALTFFGKERFDHHHVHPHESPVVMWAPLAVLAVLSVFGGLLGLPPVFHVVHQLEHWLAPVTEPGRALLEAHGGVHELSHAVEWALLGLGAVIALVFAHLGFRRYVKGTESDDNVQRTQPALADFLVGAWKIDAQYYAKIVYPSKLVAFVTAVIVDQFAIDGLVNGAGGLATATGDRLKLMVDGSLKTYALWIGAGAVLLALLWMFV